MAKVMLTREEYLKRQGLLEEEVKNNGINIRLGWIVMAIIAIAAFSSIFKKEEA